MSVAVSRAVYFEVDQYESDLKTWGIWWYLNGGGLPNLGYRKINILHPKYGLLSKPKEYEPMSDRVQQVEDIVRKLPEVIQEVAREYWVFGETKKDIATKMTVWFGKKGKPKNVKSFHIDQWVSAAAMAVWFGVDRGEGKL